MSAIDSRIGYRLADLSVGAFEQMGDLPQDVQDISIHAKLKWAAVAGARTIITTLKIEYRSPQHLWAMLEIQCAYEIESIAWQAILDTSRSAPRFPNRFLEQLAAITIGTARGILFEKTQQFGGMPYLLPLLIPGKLLADEVSFDWH